MNPNNSAPMSGSNASSASNNNNNRSNRNNRGNNGSSWNNHQTSGTTTSISQFASAQPFHPQQHQYGSSQYQPQQSHSYQPHPYQQQSHPYQPQQQQSHPYQSQQPQQQQQQHPYQQQAHYQQQQHQQYAPPYGGSQPYGGPQYNGGAGQQPTFIPSQHQQNFAVPPSTQYPYPPQHSYPAQYTSSYATAAQMTSSAGGAAAAVGGASQPPTNSRPQFAKRATAETATHSSGALWVPPSAQTANGTAASTPGTKAASSSSSASHDSSATTISTPCITMITNVTQAKSTTPFDLLPLGPKVSIKSLLPHFSQYPRTPPYSSGSQGITRWFRDFQQYVLSHRQSIPSMSYRAAFDPGQEATLFLPPLEQAQIPTISAKWDILLAWFCPNENNPHTAALRAGDLGPKAGRPWLVFSNLVRVTSPSSLAAMYLWWKRHPDVPRPSLATPSGCVPKTSVDFPFLYLGLPAPEVALFFATAFKINILDLIQQYIYQLQALATIHFDLYAEITPNNINMTRFMNEQHSVIDNVHDVPYPVTLSNTPDTQFVPSPIALPLSMLVNGASMFIAPPTDAERDLYLQKTHVSLSSLDPTLFSEYVPPLWLIHAVAQIESFAEGLCRSFSYLISARCIGPSAILSPLGKIVNRWGISSPTLESKMNDLVRYGFINFISFPKTNLALEYGSMVCQDNVPLQLHLLTCLAQSKKLYEMAYFYLLFADIKRFPTSATTFITSLDTIMRSNNLSSSSSSTLSHHNLPSVITPSSIPSHLLPGADLLQDRRRLEALCPSLSSMIHSFDFNSLKNENNSTERRSFLQGYLGPSRDNYIGLAQDKIIYINSDSSYIQAFIYIINMFRLLSIDTTLFTPVIEPLRQFATSLSIPFSCQFFSPFATIPTGILPIILLNVDDTHPQSRISVFTTVFAQAYESAKKNVTNIDQRKYPHLISLERYSEYCLANWGVTCPGIEQCVLMGFDTEFLSYSLPSLSYNHYRARSSYLVQFERDNEEFIQHSQVDQSSDDVTSPTTRPILPPSERNTPLTPEQRLISTPAYNDTTLNSLPSSLSSSSQCFLPQNYVSLSQLSFGPRVLLFQWTYLRGSYSSLPVFQRDPATTHDTAYQSCITQSQLPRINPSLLLASSAAMWNTILYSPQCVLSGVSVDGDVRMHVTSWNALIADYLLFVCNDPVLIRRDNVMACQMHADTVATANAAATMTTAMTNNSNPNTSNSNATSTPVVISNGNTTPIAETASSTTTPTVGDDAATDVSSDSSSQSQSKQSNSPMSLDPVPVYGLHDILCHSEYICNVLELGDCLPHLGLSILQYSQAHHSASSLDDMITSVFDAAQAQPVSSSVDNLITNSAPAPASASAPAAASSAIETEKQNGSTILTQPITEQPQQHVTQKDSTTPPSQQQQPLTPQELLFAKFPSLANPQNTSSLAQVCRSLHVESLEYLLSPTIQRNRSITMPRQLRPIFEGDGYDTEGHSNSNNNNNNNPLTRTLSLQAIVGLILGTKKELMKKPITCSNWERCPLHIEQQIYAALDAWVALPLLHTIYSKMVYEAGVLTHQQVQEKIIQSLTISSHPIQAINALYAVDEIFQNSNPREQVQGGNKKIARNGAAATAPVATIHRNIILPVELLTEIQTTTEPKSFFL